MNVSRVLRTSITCGLLAGLISILLFESLALALTTAAAMASTLAACALLGTWLLQRTSRKPSPLRKDPS